MAGRRRPWEAAPLLTDIVVAGCAGQDCRIAGRAPGPLCAEAGTRATAPFPAPLSPLAASFLRCAPDRFSLDEAEQFLHNRVASVATLRWCSGSSRNAVRLPSGMSVQLRRNTQYAVRRGWTVALQVREVGSGAAKRQAREILLEAARRREIDVVLVWRLDRWGRSVTDLLATLQELEHLGVGFVSLTEALDLTTPAGRAMAGLLAVFAAFEREILGERTRAGLAHAREKGKRLGRPATAAVQAVEIRKLHRAGLSKSEIARRLQIGRTSVRRILGAKS